MASLAVRIGCVPATAGDGRPVAICWAIGAGGRLLWLTVIGLED